MLLFVILMLFKAILDGDAKDGSLRKSSDSAYLCHASRVVLGTRVRADAQKDWTCCYMREDGRPGANPSCWTGERGLHGIVCTTWDDEEP